MRFIDNSLGIVRLTAAYITSLIWFVDIYFWDKSAFQWLEADVLLFVILDFISSLNENTFFFLLIIVDLVVVIEPKQFFQLFLFFSSIVNVVRIVWA